MTQPVPAPYVFNAIVVDVHDGDTINVIIDRGMYDYAGSAEHPIPIRVYGINARELEEPGGPEARDHLAELLPPGSKLVLTTVKPDKYNPRWLATVTAVGIPDLGWQLVKDQWAANYFGSGTKAVPPWPRTTT